MDKEFWDKMAALWCKSFSEEDQKYVEEAAKNTAKESQKRKSGYSINPLDDADDEEDDLL